MTAKTTSPAAARTRGRQGKAKGERQTEAVAHVVVPQHVKDIVDRAAAIQGRTDTDFLVSVLSDAASKIIADDSVIRLCRSDQEVLASALLDGKPHPAPRQLARLRQALRDHAERVESV